MHAESGLRISEALKIKRERFDFSDSDFIMIRDAETAKRGDVREEIPLPLKGQLSRFTDSL